MRKKKRLELEKLMKQRQKERLTKAGTRIVGAIATTAVASFGIQKALEHAKQKKAAKKLFKDLSNVKNPEDYIVGEEVWDMTDEELANRSNEI